MPTVTLKTDDRLYQQIVLMADELHVTKSEVIRQAVAAYRENLERNKMKLIMQAASFKVRGEDNGLKGELDSLASDGLDDA
jgi:hypothetical protein